LQQQLKVNRLKLVSNDLEYDLECYELDLHRPTIPHSLLPLETKVLDELLT